MLKAILWKNWLLKRANAFGTFGEIMLPVLFMALLILIKSITTVYDSPNVAYYCGQASPWFYSEAAKYQSLGTTPPLSCTQKPAVCTTSNYYQGGFNYEYGEEIYHGYTQYGYVESAAGQSSSNNFLYTYTIADTTNTYNMLQMSNPSLPILDILQRIQGNGAILAMAPVTNNPQLNAQIQNLADFIVNLAGDESLRSVISIFTDEDSMDNYMTSRSYDDAGYGTGKIAMGIVLYAADVDSAQWDYAVRTNFTSYEDSQDEPTVACLYGSSPTYQPIYSPGKECTYTFTIPTTMFYTQDLYKPQQTQYMYGYTYSGYSTLQQVVDKYIFSQYTATVDIKASVSMMPTSTYQSDDFQYVISSTLGIFYMLSFLYPVSRMVRALVVEKETRVKEGMKMMGLTDFVYNLSWLITTLLQMTLIAVLITLVTSTTVFEYSNKLLVFIYFEMFSLAVINMCFLMATFFSRSKTASLLGPVIFFASFFPYYAVNDPSFTTETKAATCLLAPACFALGANVFADYEGGLVGVQPDNAASLTSNFSYSLCVGLMFFDAVLYGVLAWYLDKVLPSEFGTALPLYFPFLPTYWLGDDLCASTWPFSLCLTSPATNAKIDAAGAAGIQADSPLRAVLDCDSEGHYPGGAELDNEGMTAEPVSAELNKQCNDGRAVRIRRLRKVFEAQGGSERVAVNSLSLDLFEGQVTVLLGHNGAGKSTTINMLVGLIPPTSGDALMCGGLSVSSNMQAIRRKLGVCPQHDILFPELTPMQHLQMFASFKGVPSRQINDEAKRMLAEVGLLEKANAKSSTLSGGQKRKLSVGIALIGDSKIVVLDEPTSGMDPYSRRSTWNIIQRNKKGRVILLTTHFMDEADILGDRIAIMAEGKLQCVGSALFLKGAYGVGYTLTIVKQRSEANNRQDQLELEDSSDIDSQSTSTVSSALVTKNLSAHDQHSQRITSAVCHHVSVAEPLSTVGAEQSFRLPFAASAQLADLFVDLDAHRDTLGIAEYGISVTTLEEVFMRVGHAEKDVRSASAVATAKRESSIEKSILRKKEGDLVEDEDDDSWKEDSSSMDTFAWHFRALLTKRLIYGKRDQRMVLCQLVLPVMMVILGLGLLLIRPGLTQPDYILSSQQFNPLMSSSDRNYVPFFVADPITGASTTPLAEAMLANFNGENVEAAAVPLVTLDPPTLADSNVDGTFAGCSTGATPLYNMSTYLLRTQNVNSEESGSSRYGAVTLDGASNASYLAYNVMVNASAMHGVGVYVNEMHQSYLQAVTAQTTATITTRNYPLPRTFSQDNKSATTNAFVAALFCMIAFCFIPASFATFVVKEREVKAKHQQIISGVSIYAYWCSTFVFDSISYLPTALLVIAVVWAYGISSYTSGSAGSAFALLFLFFGPAVASFTYLLSYGFSSHSTAQIAIMFANFLTGLCLMVVSFVLTTIPSTQEMNLTLRYLFRLFPSFCLGDGLIQLAICTVDLSVSGGVSCPTIGRNGYDFGQSQSPYAWDIVGADIFFLGMEMIIYFALTLLMEYGMTFPSLAAWMYSYGLEDEAAKGHAVFEDEDEDVAAERTRVMTGGADDNVVRLCELRKAYQPTSERFGAVFFKAISGLCGQGNVKSAPTLKVAVQSLCFGIPKGECFGFLGINGAGKTTTLSILSGEFPPTSGSAYIDGFSISEDQSKIRRRIGYCPQFDALLDLLTVREHIELYGKIKGMRGGQLKRVVEGKLDQLDLRNFENKNAGSLSGGNKRKLSVAMATIGEPPIVFLDEPSTGMDPVARRFMWQVIARMSTEDGRCSVILTTHSMEEAEALCTRIGVMVNGRLRCLGSAQHLKLRFGDGFEVNVKTAIPAPADLGGMVQDARSSRMRNASTLAASTEMDTLLQTEMTVEKLEATRLAVNQLPPFLFAMNMPHVSVAQPSHEMTELLNLFAAEGGSLSLLLLLEWVWAEKAAKTLDRFLFCLSRGEDSHTEVLEEGKSGHSLLNVADPNGGVAHLLERSSAHSFRYRLRVRLSEADAKLGVAPSALAYIFRRFEANKKLLHVQEYSVGQTTLEQIFNQFAASQDNPEVAAITTAESNTQHEDTLADNNNTSSPLSQALTSQQDNSNITFV